MDIDRVEGSWPKDDIRRAFVAGAKWWEFHTTGATMWQSDVSLAEAEANKRYGPKPSCVDGRLSTEAQGAGFGGPIIGGSICGVFGGYLSGRCPFCGK